MGMGYDGMTSLARESLRVAAWQTLKAELYEVDGQWTALVHDRSITYKHRRHGHNVRITLDGEIFLDLKVRACEYKSEKHKFGLKEAGQVMRQILRDHA